MPIPSVQTSDGPGVSCGGSYQGGDGQQRLVVGVYLRNQRRNYSRVRRKATSHYVYTNRQGATLMQFPTCLEHDISIQLVQLHNTPTLHVR